MKVKVRVGVRVRVRVRVRVSDRVRVIIIACHHRLGSYRFVASTNVHFLFLQMSVISFYKCPFSLYKCPLCLSTKVRCLFLSLSRANLRRQLMHTCVLCSALSRVVVVVVGVDVHGR